MTQQEIDAKIGEAWKAHYTGQNDAAVAKFQEIVQDAPDNIDALWGLGLSYRNIGNKAQAIEVFEKVRELVMVKLDANSEDYERVFMLKRMVSQQIEQISVFLDRDR